MNSMQWEPAASAIIDPDAFYLVHDNGQEWRDFYLHILRGSTVAHRLNPEYIRGRPEWIAKIVQPIAPPNGERE